MQVPEQQTEPTPLQYLDGQPYDAILSWLEDSLRGKTTLPRAIPGESPELCIIRFERSLERMTRGDLREACKLLVHRFAKQTGEVLATDEENDYVDSLLCLAQALELKEIWSILCSLASDDARFSRLPTRQQKSVIGTLLDLRAPESLQFWQMIAERYPARLGVFAFSGLLRESPERALEILPTLPDDEAVADSVYVVIGQHTEDLHLVERESFLATARSMVGRLQPHIAAALTDWLGEQAPVPVEQRTARPYGRLDTALNRRRHTPFQPIPMPARIQPTSQQARV